ncbi:hypothetical protein SAMN05421642_117124, partial [Rhodococcoides kyotonense]
PLPELLRIPNPLRRPRPRDPHQHRQRIRNRPIDPVQTMLDQQIRDPRMRQPEHTTRHRLHPRQQRPTIRIRNRDSIPPPQPPHPTLDVLDHTPQLRIHDRQHHTIEQRPTTRSSRSISRHRRTSRHRRIRHHATQHRIGQRRIRFPRNAIPRKHATSLTHNPAFVEHTFEYKLKSPPSPTGSRPPHPHPRMAEQQPV